MSCCFIGHRKIENREQVFQKVKQIVERLITEKGVRIFLFGSKSEFDDICHTVVTELQSIYHDVLRVNYPRKGEYVVKKGEGELLEAQYRTVLKKEITLKEFEEEKVSGKVFKAGKSAYIERNREMIDDSEYCIFFYDEQYKPALNGFYKSSGKSGTKLAYEYALKNDKILINVAKERS